MDDDALTNVRLDNPTFALLSDDELDPHTLELLGSMPAPNVFRAAAGAPTALRAFIDMVLALLGQTELPAVEREIAILRAARVTDSGCVCTRTSG